ncbi:helix-turn-helix domain-containing protein [Qipengyuania atrilutea]|uniref:Helix-turn-helix domain-containing protein n=1 Tax=Qipengyuania atrilutea TaxID=2744473 RepID=A0A850H3N0_9SPHN|nr:helix-turn-helix domain-containing protein [Actirhodobacter atriluteus]NVD44498.1 helix-turn-helix domain-containing protein [Actirhodobacter atriluteus]
MSGGEGVAAARVRSDKELTPAALFSLDYLPVPTALSPYVTTAYHMTCDEAVIRDIQPAAVGHFLIMPRGKGLMRFADGKVDVSHETNLLTPLSRAAPFEVEGPFHAIGVAMTPHGWAALTGLDASEWGDRLLPVAEHLSAEADALGKRLCSEYRDGAKSGAECVDEIAAYIADHLHPLPPRHIELVEKTNRWLGTAISPEVDDLFIEVAYSKRQVQRLVERYFGLPPRALARKYRALRAAALLSLPKLSDEVDAQLSDAFYDQPHMIREIQHFVGRTPAKLTKPDRPYLSELIERKNFREIGNPDM